MVCLIESLQVQVLRESFRLLAWYTPSSETGWEWGRQEVGFSSHSFEQRI